MGLRLFRPHTAYGKKAGRANLRPSTRFTLQRLQELSKTSRKVVAGRRPGMEISLRKSRFPTTENRTRRRSPTLRSTRPETWLRAAAKATVRAPGWVFDAIANSVALCTENALARRRGANARNRWRPAPAPREMIFRLCRARHG